MTQISPDGLNRMYPAGVQGEIARRLGPVLVFLFRGWWAENQAARELRTGVRPASQ